MNDGAVHGDAGAALIVTAAGYEQLKRELETLSTAGRAEMTEQLREARADGDLADNPALYEVLEEQEQLERRIATLEEQLALAEIGTPTGDGSVGIGSRVRVRDLHSGDTAEYKLVGPIEADVGRGLVSLRAPIGRALAGRAAGSVVEVEAPRGMFALEILSVHPPVDGRQPARA